MFSYWSSKAIESAKALLDPGRKPPKEDSTEYWRQRAIMAEAVLQLQRPAAEAAIPLFRMASLNRKHDDLGEGRRLLKVDLINPYCYPQAASCLRRLHAPLVAMLQMITANSTDPQKNARKRGRDADSAQQAAEHYYARRGLVMEGVLSQLQRLRSKDNTPFLTVLKSFVALKTGLHKKYWDAEAKQKLLMGRTWTKELALEMTRQGLAPDFKVEEAVSFFVYDNCDYHATKAFQRTDKKPEYIKTVNIVKLPVSADPTPFSKQEYGEHSPHRP